MAIIGVATIILTLAPHGMDSGSGEVNYGMMLYFALASNEDNKIRGVEEWQYTEALEAFHRYSAYYDIDQVVLLNLTYGESHGWKIYAYNKTYGARGLLQIREIALLEYLKCHRDERKKFYSADGVLNKYQLYRPENQYRIGCWLIDRHRKRFGSLRDAIAAYNAGPETIRKAKFAYAWADKMMGSE